MYLTSIYSLLHYTILSKRYVKDACQINWQAPSKIDIEIFLSAEGLIKSFAFVTDKSAIDLYYIFILTYC